MPLTLKNFNVQVLQGVGGIYHNAQLGLISLTDDGTNWVTIADKNLGATTVYNDGDARSEANCGKCYQWGNNYGFPFSGTVSTSTSKPNVNNYGPGNYYSSSTFIQMPSGGDRAYSQNDNLRGGVTGTVAATQGPCASGYHIPSSTEWTALKTITDNLGLIGTSVPNLLKLPYGQIRNNAGTALNAVGDSCYYRLNNAFGTNAYYRAISGNSWYMLSGSSRSTPCSIRPFKNVPVIPDSTWECVYTTGLCFIAKTAGSTIKLQKSDASTPVTLETSADGRSWNTYTMGSTITLSNIGDKVYWRNTSTTNTQFSTSSSSYYYFTMTGSISCVGDLNYLINKLSTRTVGDYAFYSLFRDCTSLVKAPEVPATTIGAYCYCLLFNGCTNLVRIPSTLPATQIKDGCYEYMFGTCSSLKYVPGIRGTSAADHCYYEMYHNCSSLNFMHYLTATTLASHCYAFMYNGCTNVKVSSSQTGIYQTRFMIPHGGGGTDATNALAYMFMSTGGSFTGTPSINTNYYTANFMR